MYSAQEAEVTCGIDTVCLWIIRPSPVYDALGAQAPVKLATFPCSNHFYRRMCNLDTSKWVKMGFGVGLPTVLNPTTKPS
ncbi:hypothetical protein TNCV_3187241 [Trichonephila clavipes]|nr:hypothetical protein TNCV_3187241 [Trichonephila clavipes]